MRENATGKAPGKKISLFCVESAELVFSSDYYASLKLKRILVVGFTMQSTSILLKTVSSWHVVVWH